MKGIAAKEEVEREILKLAAAKDEERSTSYFVKHVDAAKNTVTKYLWQLVEEKLIEASLSTTHKAVFRISSAGRSWVQRLQLMEEVKKEVMGLSESELENYLTLKTENSELRFLFNPPLI